MYIFIATHSIIVRVLKKHCLVTPFSSSKDLILIQRDMFSKLDPLVLLGKKSDGC